MNKFSLLAIIPLAILLLLLHIIISISFGVLIMLAVNQFGFNFDLKLYQLFIVGLLPMSFFVKGLGK